MFDFGSFKEACSKGGEYTCTGNFAWVDIMYTTSPGVPILRSAVANLAETEYTQLMDSTMKSFPPLKVVIAVNNYTKDFKVLPSVEAQEFETLNIRQKAAHKFLAIYYTPVQWVCKISQMKKDREAQGLKISNAELAKLFSKHNFKAARGQEEITETFVENALYVWNRGLCHMEVKNALIRGAERYWEYENILVPIPGGPWRPGRGRAPSQPHPGAPARWGRGPRAWARPGARAPGPGARAQAGGGPAGRGLKSGPAGTWPRRGPPQVLVRVCY